MGSTRVIIPDRPGASEHINRIEGLAAHHSHRAFVRPVGDQWVVAIEGDEDNDKMADLYGCYVFLHQAGDDADVIRSSN